MRWSGPTVFLFKNKLIEPNLIIKEHVHFGILYTFEVKCGWPINEMLRNERTWCTNCTLSPQLLLILVSFILIKPLALSVLLSYLPPFLARLGASVSSLRAFLQALLEYGSISRTSLITIPDTLLSILFVKRRKAVQEYKESHFAHVRWHVAFGFHHVAHKSLYLVFILVKLS